uniref:Macro domain-containing protein n=1 Tax=Kalanchoe fedtschenkoi TaxID=63787 RepID=A0A7N0VD87_KALFE
MEIDAKTETPSEGKSTKTRSAAMVVVILIGAPGSGKSTFCDHVMGASCRTWVRVCQDTIGIGKAGTKAQCLAAAANALRDGKSVFIDRCNLEKEQRTDFVKLGRPEVEVHAVVLDLPAKLCIARSVKRTGHEGNLQGGKAAAVVNRMLQKKELPKLSEGFHRITLCHYESDVEAAVRSYSSLGPLDTLPSGFFGEKKLDNKVQVGIMKFLKKAENPVNARSDTDNSYPQSAVSNKCPTANSYFKKDPECDTSSPYIGRQKSNDNEMFDIVVEKASDVMSRAGIKITSVDDIPTLAFPSISTADFQFNLEKASDIIVEKVEEFVNKVPNVRLVLVDLSKGSKILSMVEAKVSKKNIDSKRFFTFVGNITRLFSEGGLHCNVIANAANWRLKPGGGGVNAAVFSEAGPSLEVATREKAANLHPGKAVVVPLPASSPLFSREGVTHVIHVLGPNMNPQRPDCLNNDYQKGCEVLCSAYSSLFEGFASVVRSQDAKHSENSKILELGGDHRNFSADSDLKVKRGNAYEYGKNKKSKGTQEEPQFSSLIGKERNENAENKKSWGSWAQALYNISMNPEKHRNSVLEISDNAIVLNDLYPKARRHVLVVARYQHLDWLGDVQKEHLPLLKGMHTVGLKWAEKFMSEDSSLVFRIGYHSVHHHCSCHTFKY